MTFIWPGMLFLLVIIPLLILLYLRIQRRRRAVAQFGRPTLTQPALGGQPGSGKQAPASSSAAFKARQAGPASRSGTPKDRPAGPGARRHVPPAMFLASLAILTVALARPQTVVNLPRIEGTVILAFDVSGSMAADDLKPTRMEAAKAAARDFVQRQPPSVQIGVVGYSDSGFSMQPPTNNPDEVIAAINRLTPQRGTSVGHGIEASLNAIDSGTGRSQGPLLYSNLTPEPSPSPTPVPQGTYTSAAIVLLTDGDNNEAPDPLAAAQSAADRGIRIYTVGIGSPAGTNLHINGFTVHTQLNEELLKQIAQITNGTYFNAESETDLRQIYDNLNPELIIKPEKMEITSLFAGASVVIMLIGGAFSLLWFNRIP